MQEMGWDGGWMEGVLVVTGSSAYFLRKSLFFFRVLSVLSIIIYFVNYSLGDDDDDDDDAGGGNDGDTETG